MDAITETDLLAEIGREELDGLAAELIEEGQPDPIAAAIEESLGLIKMYADPLIIPDDALKRIWRILAVCSIYNRLASLPEKREKQQSWAITTLKEIRDGKFKNLVVDEEADETGSQGAWGSSTKISTR